MINLKNIQTVATYERKTLFRSWFFKIFSILTILILFGINMGMFAEPGARWIGRAIPANLPYINVLFVNVAQAIIAVFLASDFIRRDKKLDTTEVIYARPISNGEYVVGKTLGIMTLFMGLVAVVLLMGLVFNIVIQDTPVVWQAYLLYPLLISIPTLVFILGLSFFLMILLRSQAVTFIVLLGYIGLTLFYFKDKLHGMLDYMAFNLPMVYSDFIQFADLQAILLQRSAYFLMGLGFIFATIRFLSRLPQTGRWNLINLFGFILFLAAGVFSGYTFYSGFHTDEANREQYLRLNNRYAEYPVVDILSNNLEVTQDGSRLTVSSQLLVRNQNRARLDTLLFTLNPGFKTDSITGRDGAVEYSRTGHLIKLVPERAIAPGRTAGFTFYYHGVPEEAVAYLDIPKKQLASLKRILVATIDKKPGIIDENYLLLTRELLWYPVAGVGFNTTTFQSAVTDFVRFQLTVKPNRGLTAIAPGAMEEKEGTQIFRPESDLSTLPLVIGPYEKRSRVMDGVEYNIFIKPDHDFFSGFFPTISDTIEAIVKEEKGDYEYEELDLYYPFHRVNIIETPIQFHPYERPYRLSVESIQPEMIFLPEKGAGLNTLDFKRLKRAEERRNRERNNTRTPEEIEIDLFKNFVGNTFFRSELTSRGWFRGDSDNLITFGGEPLYTTNPWCVFPLYYSYVTEISSSIYPVFNSMIETYLKDGYEVSPRQSFVGGITNSERANLALKEQSLIDIFSLWNSELTTSAIYQAGSFILKVLKNRVGSSEFDNFLYYYLEDHAFTEITFEQFAADFRAEFDLDIAPFLDFIQAGNQLPEFLVSAPEYYQTRDDYGDVYVVRMKISNVGKTTGLIELSFRLPGQGGFGGGPGSMSTENRLYEVEAGTTKEVQLLFYDQPRMLTINTVISGNIPSSFGVFLRSAEVKSVSPLEDYDKVIGYSTAGDNTNEIIVDNEDEGFDYVSVSNESKIKKYIDSRKKPTANIEYGSLSQYWSPAVWTPVAHSAYYGQTIRSAMVSRKGDGSNKARWSAVMPEAGFYELYVYIPVSAMFSGPGRGRGGDRNEQQSGQQQGQRQGQGQGSRGPQFADQGTVYTYLVSSNEGEEKVELKLNFMDDGWNRLGSFHFPADSAMVELSNSTSGTRVIADAVKWVKIED